MSFSLKIQDGDLVAVGNRLDVVWGVEKLDQDVNMWLMERYGGDRFHTNMGSILREFIGQIASESARAEIQGEVYRVLQNYKALQDRKVNETPELMSASELLVNIEDVIANLSYDTVSVVAKLRNGAGTISTVKVANRVGG